MRARSCWIGPVLATLAAFPATAGAADVGKKGPDPIRSSKDAQALAETIDRLLAEKWAAAKIVPAGPAGDAEFLRRVCLDLVGKIPTAAEAREVLEDKSLDKRAKLLERLLH